MDVSRFDLRRYPTLSVVEGYGEWSESFETAVLEEMDLRLLSRLQAVEW